ncbi:hypothetical protein G6F31_021742 [Rhizopus arrhizus]|nr:hypothetical protein G6F32_017398 [Rhizopus arrhizus]KAG0906845.1 hypothetical protein G6F31_021742 [Rhizopus arrhizus]
MLETPAAASSVSRRSYSPLAGMAIVLCQQVGNRYEMRRAATQGRGMPSNRFCMKAKARAPVSAISTWGYVR